MSEAHRRTGAWCLGLALVCISSMVGSTFGFVLVSSAVLAFFVCVVCPNREHSIEGRVVLVTGAAHGIGKNIALKLSKTGCKLVLWDLNKTMLELVAKELRLNENCQVWAYEVDVADEERVEEVLAMMAESVGPVDILINNAGVVSGKHIIDSSPEDVRKTLAINTEAPVSLIRRLLPSMLKRKRGHIVNMSSVMAHFYGTGLGDYCMSKAGLAAFHHCLRLELRRQQLPDLHTTMIMPYVVDTGMFNGMRQPWLVTLIFPMLTVKAVASRTCSAILRREEVVVIPALVGWVIPILMMLPVRVQDLLTEVVGGRYGMDTFTGHKDQ